MNTSSKLITLCLKLIAEASKMMRILRKRSLITEDYSIKFETFVNALKTECLNETSAESELRKQQLNLTLTHIYNTQSTLTDTTLTDTEKINKLKNTNSILIMRVRAMQRNAQLARSIMRDKKL